jgi:hypothetical protein
MRSVFLSLLAVSVAAAAECDRACLTGFVTRYLDAMLAHNPAALPVSANLRFTENGQPMRLGEGIWKDASRVRPYRLDILDVREGVAASQVVVEEAGSPVLLVVRLKVGGGKIAEIETMVTRSQKEGAIFSFDALETPRKEMTFAPDRTQLSSREETVKLAEFYPAGLKVGSFVDVDAPFAADAYRIENGRITAGPGCARAGCENIKTQRIIKHPAITYKAAAVDEDLGIVLLRMNFGDTGSYGPGNALYVWEAFKVYGGKIHAVEAFMRVMPANAGWGWD